MGVGIGGDKWPAAELFCELVTDPRWRPYFQGLFEGKTVIELGAGTGFVGILLEKLFKPKEIAISDQGSHIDLIDRNISENAATLCAAVELDWFKLPIDNQKFDIVLAFEW
jgi:methylase of polypeptide subunit release factors